MSFTAKGGALRQEISRKKPVLKNRVLQTEDAIVASVSTRRGPEILTRLITIISRLKDGHRKGDDARLLVAAILCNQK
jgi:hypothetical protein